MKQPTNRAKCNSMTLSLRRFVVTHTQRSQNAEATVREGRWWARLALVGSADGGSSTDGNFLYVPATF